MSKYSAQRRHFLKQMGVGTGLTLGVSLLPKATFAATNQTQTAHLAPNVFVAITEDGTLEVTCHRSEMGQQIRTAITQIIADELDADWQRVKTLQADGDKKYGDQNTDGSRSIRRNLARLQMAGATAALLLKQAAAKGWNVEPDSCQCKNHQVIHTASGRSADFSQLVSVAATLPMPEEGLVKPKARKDWRYVGKGIRSIDMEAVQAGTTIFGQDITIDDMLYAVIQRPPVMFTQPDSVDDKKARSMKGVKDVITLPTASAPANFFPLGGVAVLADNTWTAMQGVKALNITWTENDHSKYDSQSEKQILKETARKAGEVVRQRGDIKQALNSAHKTVEATYYAPLLAQAPMEPPAAAARVDGDSAEVWTSTQNPQAAQALVAEILKIPVENVTIHVTLLGGGFGRKSKPDFAAEAAWLAQKAGRPVKVVWRREDDIQHGFYHTVSAQHIRAALDENGNAIAWHHNTVFPTISSTFSTEANSPSSGELRLGFIDNPFDIPNIQLEKGQAKNHVRIGWLRSVANVYHAYAIHTFADELAYAAGKDSKAYLQQLIGKPRHIDLAKEGAEYDNYGDPLETYPIDTGRLRAVLDKATEMARWDDREKEKRHLGVAAHRSFLSYVATVVEVVVDDNGSWRIPNAYICIDAGTIVNSEHVKAQCEGGAIFGLSCAIGEISATDGAINQTNFHNYQVARMQHAPENIEVHIVDSDAAPGGVGEPPTPPFAPALANALFAATGKRIQELPIPLTLKA
ncbi:xanthine dehydrogenase family protein molybdopterin-binding subunit [Salinimonas iocasae]|uniref:Xanthine dehydrogenase family protein molybdopterin-binding subunit n=1 Tax=Salinimonas iocasae TaxID=2572577 RepID=A0A5B7YFQ2_9ALTE|nr:molybdopterin cofactor-binding domain-containing protein [Salinimonas iocasae]QCZ93229.1 xanthine dehydrogenase family protein molybdopterin-binding subunit [Salinimonas iocasae]